jgi:hypothetical protein
MFVPFLIAMGLGEAAFFITVAFIAPFVFATRMRHDGEFPLVSPEANRPAVARISAVSPRKFVDQPLTGFGYSYWFTCTGCGRRVNIAADLYELQCTSRAGRSVCECGTEVDVTAESPTLRDTEDIALQTDSADRLVWYHSSRFENWPDLEAYTAEVTARARATAAQFPMFNPDRWIEHKLSLAVHLGTYEATIENILRRISDEDRIDLFEACYWLHRVEIGLDYPDYLHPEVVPEFATLMGDVELAQLHALGAGAARYINLHEAVGSVSLAIDPAIVHAVSTIELPVAEAALPETATASAATAKMAAAVEQSRDDDDDTTAPWDEFLGTLQSEYLPRVNEQVREPFSTESATTRIRQNFIGASGSWQDYWCGPRW